MTAVPKDEEVRLASRFTLLAASLYAAYAMIPVFRTAPAWKMVFEDMGKSLPPPAELIVSPALPWVCCAVLFCNLAKEWLFRRPKTTLLLNCALVVVVELLLQVSRPALLLPFADLIRGMD